MFNNGNRAHKVSVKCPHCGGDNLYRELWSEDSPARTMGQGCQHCNKKIKIKLGIV